MPRLSAPPQRECRFALAPANLQTLNQEKRRFQAVANDSSIVDSYQSMIIEEAWPEDMGLFLQNPIGLWMHGMGCMETPPPPIFSPEDLAVEPGVGLSFWPTFQREGIDKFADMIYGKYTEIPRLLRAFSVGFFPLRWVGRDDAEESKDPFAEKARALFGLHLSLRRVYTRVRLDEISAVDLPANRGSLARNAMGQVQLNPGMISAIESLGFVRVNGEDADNAVLGQQEVGIGEIVETFDVLSSRLADVARTELAAQEMKILGDVYMRLAAICGQPLQENLDQEIDAAMEMAAGKITTLAAANEDLLGMIMALASAKTDGGEE